MKLISSDYDNTLNCIIIDLIINKYYIKKYLKNNNLFLLNTGRTLESIKREIKKYNIPFNYLSCSDGNLLLDCNYNVIYASNISLDIYDELNKLKEEYEFEIKIIKYLDKILEYELIIFKLDKTFLTQLDKIMLKYKLCYKTFKKFNNHLYIYSKDINKTTPIKYLENLYKLNYNNIYTIGDNINDLEMLRDYNGYLVFWAKKDMRKYTKNICYLVSRLINKINKK